MDDLTKIGLARKSNAGRKAIYNELTRSLSFQVPMSEYSRLKKLLQDELEKLKIKY